MIRVCLPRGRDFGWGVAGERILAELAKLTEISIPTDPRWPLLMAVSGPDFMPMRFLPAAGRNLGLAFIERPSVAKEYVRNYQIHYTGLVCGSTWMEQKMREIGVGPCYVVPQGIDFDRFCPGEGQRDDAPFTVFVGGKAEIRKGTDISIAALAVFLEKHKDAKAIFAIANQWPVTIHTLRQSKWIKYESISDDWVRQMDVTMRTANLPMDRVRLEPLRENFSMPSLYRSAHVGLFPSRAEAGENMMMTEAIACGLPVIGSYATGQKDILGSCGWLLLTDGKITEPDGWWEPNSLDEILSALEIAYANQDYTKQRGRQDAAHIRTIRGWDKCAKALFALLND